MNNIMIDLETFSTKKTAVFISIGACYFDPMTGEIGETFYMNIDWQSALDTGRIIDAATLKWWFNQSEAAITAILKDGKPLITALIALSNFVKKNNIIWANSPSFDIVMLEDAFNKAKMEVPWAFWNVHDVRTLKALARDIVDKKVFDLQGIANNALDDAIHQAKYTSACYCALKGFK